jgi:hypothetical protein
VTRDDGKSWETVSPDLTAFKTERQVISGAPITRDITGEEFYSTIYAIRESPVQQGQIWVGANDGPVHVTFNDGRKWEEVTPGDLPPDGRIDCVEPSPHDAHKAYFTALRYQLNDWKPYIYKTADKGKSWTRITNGIPDGYPVRVVREDPAVEGLLYAGTEFGMFISLDDGGHWQPFQQNLPVTPVTDIKVHGGNLNISTMGRGFWILDDLSPLYKAAARDKMEKAVLFAPLDTYMLRYRGTRGESVPAYPAPGVLVSYYLPDTLEDGLEISIMDHSGKLVRSFSAAGTDTTDTDAEADMSTGFRRRGSQTQLKSTPGLHRFRWDMQHAGPWDKKTPQGGTNGPRVSPGKYTVQMKSAHGTQHHSFELMPDPRISAAGVTKHDLGKQESLSLEIRDLLSSARKLEDFIQTELKAVKEKLEEKPKHKKSVSRKELLESARDALKTPEGRYMQPMLIDQIRYLSSMLNRADQLPGRDAYDRFRELESAYTRIAKEVDYRAGS